MDATPPDPVILDGAAVSKKILATCAQRVEAIKQKTGVTPCLATVLVGSDPASATYVKMKGRRCEAVGMKSLRVAMDEATTTDQLVEKIHDLGNDPAVHGILLQHPVPAQVDERAAFEAIPLEKDADGVTLKGFAHVSFGLPGLAPCTPAGVMTLLKEYDVDPAGKHAVVIGRSPILGKPMAMMLLQANATVTICHSRTRNLPELVKQADLVVAAVGRPRFVQGDWIKPGAVVVDTGYNPGNVGDTDYESCAAKASMITPVPGGVGPMTIATLIDQTVTAAARQLGVDPA